MHNYSPSSSYIVTVAWSGLPAETWAGSDVWSIARRKRSSFSNKTSSVIATVNKALFTPAGNVTVYGPEP